MILGEHKLIHGRFEIANPATDQIGYGGMGTVYRGLDHQSGADVAVKVLRMDSITAPRDVVDRFLREGEALRLLDHPNIVEVIDTAHEADLGGGPDGAYFLVMEYADGGTLRDLLKKRGQLPISQALEIALDLSDALARAHRIGIIHRDIKPGNVLLTASGQPLLTDFGLALLSDRSSLTQPGTLVGTVGYMSPEGCGGEQLDELSDVWSFGVLLWEMLTGQQPFLRQTIAATLSAIISDPLPDLKALCPEAQPRLEQLLVSMLRKDRRRRLSSMRFAGAELEAILAGRDELPFGSASVETLYPVAEPAADELDTLSGRKAITLFIDQCRERGESILSHSNLMYAYSVNEELVLNEEEATFLLRSALTYGEPVEPWLVALGSPESIYKSLKTFYEKYPRPEVRCRIVDNLAALPEDQTSDLLLAIAYRDDAPNVRIQAALLCAQRGHRAQVTSHSLAQAMEGRDAAALATLVSLADVYGLPGEASLNLKLQIMLMLARERWLAKRRFIWRQSVRTMLGGGLLVLYGLAVPSLMRTTALSVYEATMTYMTLPAYHVVSVILFGFFGLRQGLASGLLVGLADALQPGAFRARWHFIAGALSGLVFTVDFILLTLLGGDTSEVNRALLIWGNILYGLLMGAILSQVIPPLATSRSRRRQVRQMITAVAVASVFSVPYVWLFYPNDAQELFASRLLLIIMLPVAIGLPFLLAGDASSLGSSDGES